MIKQLYSIIKIIHFSKHYINSIKIFLNKQSINNLHILIIKFKM